MHNDYNFLSGFLTRVLLFYLKILYTYYTEIAYILNSDVLKSRVPCRTLIQLFSCDLIPEDLKKVICKVMKVFANTRWCVQLWVFHPVHKD